jgi:hypothetical protein
MNFSLAFWVGVAIFIIGLFNKKLAGWITFLGFLPFWLAATAGVIGVALNPSTANTAAANIMDQGTKMVFDEIVGTYIVGTAIGWIPQLFMSKKHSRG